MASVLVLGDVRENRESVMVSELVLGDLSENADLMDLIVDVVGCEPADMITAITNSNFFHMSRIISQKLFKMLFLSSIIALLNLNKVVKKKNTPSTRVCD